MSLNTLAIFVACPGDCVVERDMVYEVADELESIANDKGFTLKIKEWTQVAPDMGRPQQVIFDQLPVESWDIFVGMLWTRFGTRPLGTNILTGTAAESGTEEEFAAALNAFRQNGKPRILFYRRTGGPTDISRLDLAQLALVQQFFKNFDAGQPFEGFYRPYEAPDQFRTLLRAHLQAILLSNGITSSPRPEIPSVSPDDFITPTVVEAARTKILSSYDVLKLHRISSAYDAGSALRADRDRVRLQDVFVPQRVADVNAFVAERLPAPSDIQKTNDGELRLLGIEHHRRLRKAKRQPVLTVLESHLRVVLLGDPGAGKSSILQHRALTWARDAVPTGPLPLLLEMRRYAERVQRAKDERARRPSILAWVAEMLAAAVGAEPVSEDRVVTSLSEGRLELLCDALDEIFDPHVRRHAAEQLAEIAQAAPNGRIIVSSRPVGYPDDLLIPANFDHWMVLEFDRPQIDTFLNRWTSAALTDPDDREKVTARLKSALEIARVREMAGNPLLLTLMSILARTDELPRDRMRLYSKAAELLLYQWDTSRSLRPLGDFDFAYEQKHRVLRELAWRMQNAQLGLSGNLAPMEMVKEVFDDELKADLARPGERAKGVELLLNTLRERDHVLCHLGGDRFAFVHRGFLEYFCADWLSERVRRSPSDAEQELRSVFSKHVNESFWSDALALSASALAPEVADEVLSTIDISLKKKKNGLRWLATLTLIDAKARARFPKTAAKLREELTKHAENIEGSGASSAISALATYWYDETTRSLLTRLAMLATNSKGSRWAVLKLTERWPDDRTRTFLESIVPATRESGEGRIAVNQIASRWVDERSRNFLSTIAVQDDFSPVRRAALRQLALRWPDERTALLLRIVSQRESGRALLNDLTQSKKQGTVEYRSMIRGALS